MGTLTKKHLIERVAARTGVSRQACRAVVQEFLDQMILELKRGNRIEFRDFGVFEVRLRSARVAQNPKTLAEVRVPARRTVKFKMGRLMRESVAAEPRPAPEPATPHGVEVVHGRAQRSRV